MTTAKKRNAPLAGKGALKKPHANNNSASAQRQRLLDALRKSSVSTIRARRDLDIMHVAGRVMELRRFGHRIDTVWIVEQTDCGKQHRVGLYILRQSRHGL